MRIAGVRIPALVLALLALLLGFILAKRGVELMPFIPAMNPASSSAAV